MYGRFLFLKIISPSNFRFQNNFLLFLIILELLRGNNAWSFKKAQKTSAFLLFF